MSKRRKVKKGPIKFIIIILLFLIIGISITKYIEYRNSYKYKLKPTVKQQQKLNMFFGCSRFVYNWGLEQKIQKYQKYFQD